MSHSEGQTATPTPGPVPSADCERTGEPAFANTLVPVTTPSDGTTPDIEKDELAQSRPVPHLGAPRCCGQNGASSGQSQRHVMGTLKTTSASDTNAGLSRLVAADHSQAHEHGWTELLTISLGRHAEFARSSRSITSTTSATNRAGRSGQSLHVCAPLFEDPTVSISHPTERPPRITPDPPLNGPATSDMGSIAMCVARIAASRADWGARNRLCCPRARIIHCCRFRPTGGTPGMRSAGYAASADRSCLVTLSRFGVCAPPYRAARAPCLAAQVRP